MRGEVRQKTTQTRVPAAAEAEARFLEVLYSPVPGLVGTRFPLVTSEVRLGRQPMLPPHASFEDESMSRLHARVCFLARESAHVVVDEGSTNGTRLNGALVHEGPLQLGDVVRLGDTLFLYSSYGPEDDDASELGETSLAGHSSAIRAIVRRIARIAPSPLSVLALGESGTGKELVAHDVHARSGRTGAFVAANCAAIPATLIESELFGHTRGAFTGALATAPGLFRAAHGGTLFLDEIGELAPELQARLLRVIETGEVRAIGSVAPTRVDVRIVAATNVDITKAIAEGRFRGDLFARLDQVRIALPPLRARRDDILPLFRHLRDRETGGASHLSPDPDAAEALVLHDWPYNVRELEKTVRLLLVEHPELALFGPALLPEGIVRRAAPDSAPLPSILDAHDLETVVTRARAAAVPEKADLERLLRHFRGNVSEVAVAVGKDRRQVYRWVERFGLDAALFRI